MHLVDKKYKNDIVIGFSVGLVSLFSVYASLFLSLAPYRE